MRISTARLRTDDVERVRDHPTPFSDHLGSGDDDTDDDDDFDEEFKSSQLLSMTTWVKIMVVWTIIGHGIR